MFVYGVFAIILNVTVGTTNILYLYNAEQTPFVNWHWSRSIPMMAILYFIPFYMFYYYQNSKHIDKPIHLHAYIKERRTSNIINRG